MCLFLRFLQTRTNVKETIPYQLTIFTVYYQREWIFVCFIASLNIKWNKKLFNNIYKHQNIPKLGCQQTHTTLIIGNNLTRFQC